MSKEDQSLLGAVDARRLLRYLLLFVLICLLVPFLELLVFAIRNNLRTTSFTADVTLTVAQIVKTPGTQEINGNWSSDDCGYQQQVSSEKCYADKIADWKVAISSANCGSTVVVGHGSGPECLAITEVRHGCGYDNLPFGIKNCKGRGWLQYTVVASTIALTTRPLITDTRLSGKSVDDEFSAMIPGLAFPLDELSFRWQATVTDAKGSAYLTSEKPSGEVYRAKIEQRGGKVFFVIFRASEDRRTSP